MTSEGCSSAVRDLAALSEGNLSEPGLRRLAGHLHGCAPCRALFASLAKDADGTWRLTTAHVPPLLQVGTTPYLQAPLADLEARITNLEPQLVAQLQDTFLRPERLQAIT